MTATCRIRVASIAARSAVWNSPLTPSPSAWVYCPRFQRPPTDRPTDPTHRGRELEPFDPLPRSGSPFQRRLRVARLRSDFRLTPFESNHSRIARLICSETATPSRRHTSCSPSIKSSSIRNVIVLLTGVMDEHCKTSSYVVQRLPGLLTLVKWFLHSRARLPIWPYVTLCPRLK